MTSAIRSDKLRRLRDAAIAQGWTERTDGRGHVRLTSPGGVWFTITSSGTGARMSGRYYENTKAKARRAGLNVSGL